LIKNKWYSFIQIDRVHWYNTNLQKTKMVNMRTNSQHSCHKTTMYVILEIWVHSSLWNNHVFGSAMLTASKLLIGSALHRSKLIWQCELNKHLSKTEKTNNIPQRQRRTKQGRTKKTNSLKKKLNKCKNHLFK